MGLVSEKAGDKKTFFEKMSIILSPIILSITLLSFLLTSVFDVFGFSKDLRKNMDDFIQFKAEIVTFMKEDSNLHKNVSDSLDNRIDITDRHLQNLQNNLDRVTDRVSNVESKVDGFDKLIKELQSSLHNQYILTTQQSGDIKVIREILQRVEDHTNKGSK